MSNEPQFLEDDEMDLAGVLKDAEAAANAAARLVPKEGKMYLRIVPQAPGEDGRKRKYYQPFGQHFGWQDLTGNPFAPRASRCLHLTLQQNCKGCEKNLELSKKIKNPDGTIDQEVKDLVWSTRGQIRFALNVLEVTPRNAALSPEVKVWEISEKTLESLNGIFQLYGNIASTKTGSVIEVTFTKKGFGLQVTNIQKCPGEGPIPLPDWAESRKDLLKFVEADCLTYAEQAATFNDVEPNGGSMAGPATHQPNSQSPSRATQDGSGDTPQVGNGSQNIVPSHGYAGPVSSTEVGASDENDEPGSASASEIEADDIYQRMLAKAGPEARKKLLEKLAASA